MSKFKNVLLFAAGTGVGVAFAWGYLRSKYDKILKKEVNSVKDAFSTGLDLPKREEKDDISKTKTLDKTSLTEKKSINEYAEMLAQREGYSDYSQQGGDTVNKPYVISPDTFGDDDYDMETLTLYSDGVLTDDMVDPIEDVIGLIGEKALTSFGQYEDDVVYVRNDRLKTDYEILKDPETYKENIREYEKGEG